MLDCSYKRRKKITSELRSLLVAEILGPIAFFRSSQGKQVVEVIVFQKNSQKIKRKNTSVQSNYQPVFNFHQLLLPSKLRSKEQAWIVRARSPLLTGATPL